MYSLLIVGTKGYWDNGGGNFDLSRYLEHTDEVIKHDLKPMTLEVIEQLKSWPVLFAYETSKYDDPSDIVAHVGRFKSISVRNTQVRISFEFDNSVAPIAAEKLRAMLWDLDIEHELSRTHWAVKQVDLFDVLRKKNLLDCLPAPVSMPDIQVVSEAVERALIDAEALIESGRASSAIDRVHTALHGYLIQLCISADLIQSSAEYPSMTALFKLLREKHPKFIYSGPRAAEVGSALKASPSIIEAINTLRNNASVAHPNEEIVREPEAMYLVNLTRSLLHYIEMKRKDKVEV